MFTLIGESTIVAHSKVICRLREIPVTNHHKKWRIVVLSCRLSWVCQNLTDGNICDIFKAKLSKMVKAKETENKNKSRRIKSNTKKTQKHFHSGISSSLFIKAFLNFHILLQYLKQRSDVTEQLYITAQKNNKNSNNKIRQLSWLFGPKVSENSRSREFS